MTRGDLVVTPSNYIAGYLKANYDFDAKKLRVIPRAIDRAKFDPAKLDGEFTARVRREWRTEGRFVVMGIGRITQLKGYDVLIRAMAKLPERFMLVIVGEAERLRRDVEDRLKALVAGLGLSDRVVFAGNQSKVAECISVADVVVSANTKKPEAFGRSMAEALAMGRPVVARAFGGALDVVRDGVDGVLVPCDGSVPVEDEFAAAVEKVAEMKFSGLRESALERFSFDAMLEKSLDVYRELSRPRRPAHKE
jgi:glycosyltransferase involved in cell wall biosynthesis